MTKSFTLSNYPVFAPPFELPERKVARWSREESRRYMDWFMSIKAARASHLLEVLGVTDDLPQQMIQILEHKIDNLALGGDGSGLPPIALSIGVDSGLVLAQILEHAEPVKLKWGLISPDDERHVSSGLPGLNGFLNDRSFDPVLVGSNMIRRVGMGAPSGLRTAFETWLRFIP